MSVVMLLGIASCSDDEVVKNHVQPGEVVRFSIDQRSSRTVYEAEDGDGSSWQIDWVKGDGITIFCQQAEGAKSADYTITPTEDAAHTIKLTEAGSQSKYGLVDDNPNGLCWNGAIINENPEHNFYAAYPNGVAKTTDTEGVLEFPIGNQYCTLTGSANSDGEYTTSPDMKNAYMVAAATSIKAGDIKSSKDPSKKGSIKLVFAPIMTTLDITASYQTTTSNVEPVRIYGLRVTVPNVPTVNNSFLYNVKNNTLSVDPSNPTGTQGNIVAEGISSKSVTINVGFADRDFLSLEKGQSVNFTAFLPPVSATDMKNVKITLIANGGDYGTVTLNTEVKPSSKRKVKLPAVVQSVEPTSNNWISLLDDNVYVNQLSIPGTNNSAAYQSYSDAASSQGESQSLTKQWNTGVRAFEFRTSVAAITASYGTFQLCCYDSGVNLKRTFKEAMDELVKLLKDNPSEFAVVIVGFQSQSFKDGSWTQGLASYINRMDKSYWEAETKRSVATVGQNAHGIPYYVKNYTDYYATFTPDMTVKDARGKIIMINYDDYTGRSGVLVNGAETANGAREDFAPAGSWYSGTYGNTTGTSDLFYIQAMSGPTYGDVTDNKHGAKQAGIIKADDEAVKLHKATDGTYKWVINYVGGANDQNSEGYASTAGANNLFYKEWLNGITKNGKTREPGPTGIVLVSHQGIVKAPNGTVVNGEELPMAIINNNFSSKFQMKTKTTGN